MRSLSEGRIITRTLQCSYGVCVRLSNGQLRETSLTDVVTTVQMIPAVDAITLYRSVLNDRWLMESLIHRATIERMAFTSTWAQFIIHEAPVRYASDVVASTVIVSAALYIAPSVDYVHYSRSSSLSVSTDDRVSLLKAQRDRSMVSECQRAVVQQRSAIDR